MVPWVIALVPFRLMPSLPALHITGLVGTRSGRIAAFDDNGFHLACAGAAKSRGGVIFGRCETGGALLECRELDHDKAVEFVRPFHDLIATTAGEDLAAVLGDNAGNEIGVLLVFDGIIDLRSRNPIGR